MPPGISALQRYTANTVGYCVDFFKLTLRMIHKREKNPHEFQNRFRVELGQDTSSRENYKKVCTENCCSE